MAAALRRCALSGALAFWHPREVAHDTAAAHRAVSSPCTGYMALVVSGGKGEDASVHTYIQQHSALFYYNALFILILITCCRRRRRCQVADHLSGHVLPLRTVRIGQS